ncbi:MULTISPECIES: hypothetical protein [Eikenella]|uniref:hypothetical protein n=1 Tax=Eikenella TaxID=538 RepID=UPI0012E7566F|nr:MULTISPECIES: hypothetical protein [Eikenella]
MNGERHEKRLPENERSEFLRSKNKHSEFRQNEHSEVSAKLKFSGSLDLSGARG